LPTLRTYNALQFLDNQGILSISQEFSEKISMQFIIPSKEVIRYMSLHPDDEEIIVTILRTYPGIHDNQTSLNTQLIAKKANVPEFKISQLLEKLKERNIIDYVSKKNDTSITFNEVREDDKTINRVTKHLETQNKLKIEQLQSVLKYINDKKSCKNTLLLDYFGEKTSTYCGICSFCIQKKKPTKSDASSISEKIIELLKIQDFNARDIQKLTKFSKDDVIFALQTLMENDKVIIQPNNLYTLKK
jgi:ATP-dependent DNA helicase RecQ